MARRSVWNSVYFIGTSAGEYSWDIEVLINGRVVHSYTIKADHMDDAKRIVLDQLESGQEARIDGTEYVKKY